MDATPKSHAESIGATETQRAQSLLGELSAVVSDWTGPLDRKADSRELELLYGAAKSLGELRAYLESAAGQRLRREARLARTQHSYVPGRGGMVGACDVVPAGEYVADQSLMGRASPGYRHAVMRERAHGGKQAVPVDGRPVCFEAHGVAVLREGVAPRSNRPDTRPVVLRFALDAGVSIDVQVSQAVWGEVEGRSEKGEVKKPGRCTQHSGGAGEEASREAAKTQSQRSALKKEGGA